MASSAVQAAWRNENALLFGQKRILEMVATGAALTDTLAELMLFIEAQEPHLRCGILIVSDDGEHFRRGSGPNLPETYHSALDGVPITPPYLGPCGEAAHTDTAVVVPDIATDARWADIWRELVMSCGLAACRSTPVRGSDSRVLASFAMYYDHPRDPHPANPELIEIATHLAAIALERKQAEEALEMRERRLREVVEALPAAVYTTDADGSVALYNQAAIDLWGMRPVPGDAQWCGSWRLFRPDGTPLSHNECPMAQAIKENRAIRGAEAVAERPDGTRIPFLAYPTPLRDGRGELAGAVNMLMDISERKAAEAELHEREARLRLLAREVDHRARNMLATVQAVARMTKGETVPAFARTLMGRLGALSRAHTLLAQSRWIGADLARLVEEELAAYRTGDASRVTIEGPPLALRSEAAQVIAMAVHELATNAAKYGALSTPNGRVAVNWSWDSDHRLTLRWIETGGPPVGTPSHRGFGTDLIEIAVSGQLEGAVHLDWPTEGLVCCMSIPMKRLVGQEEPLPTN